MACDRPCGNCTDVSPCGPGGGCGCSGADPTPIAPRCRDVVLTPGTYTNATVVVNEEGCIVAVAAGEPEVYTPDECCDGEGTGAPGLPGPRGIQGDPGAAATVSVDPVVLVGDTPGWSVENVGTIQAAVFQFTAPAPVDPGGLPSGFTGNVGGAATGLIVEDGIVTQLPDGIVSAVTAEVAGSFASSITFTSTPLSPAFPNRRVLTLNLDAFAEQLSLSVGNCCSSLNTRMDALDVQIAEMPASVFEVAAATGVILRDAGGLVVFATRVAGVANVWAFGAANTGRTITQFGGQTFVLDVNGNALLSALSYPIGIV